jgi:DNA (cytosine-5)-methyltransferase 1
MTWEKTEEEKVWRVLDLYCCAGGGAKGYENAGFNEIIGVDCVGKKEYPYFFIKADIEDFIYDKPVEWFESFDLIHASPPCQADTRLVKMCEAQGNIPCDKGYHIPMIRQFLKSLDVEYVIENVEGAWEKEERKKTPFTCGSHFDLAVQRHRYFEASFPIEQLKCNHKTSAWPIGPKGRPKPIGVYGSKNDRLKGMCTRTGKMQTGGWTAKDVPEAQKALGIEHIATWRNLCEALPPKYTEHVAKCFFKHMEQKEILQSSIEMSEAQKKLN